MHISCSSLKCCKHWFTGEDLLTVSTFVAENMRLFHKAVKYRKQMNSEISNFHKVCGLGAEIKMNYGTRCLIMITDLCCLVKHTNFPSSISPNGIHPLYTSCVFTA